MKKLLSIMLAGVLMFGLAALAGCQKEEPVSSSTPPVSKSQPEPEPEPEIVEGGYLTGIEKGKDYVQDRRITGIMVNNIAASRPWRGLSQADVLVEIVTEGGISRFMALYENYEDIPETGSVRSLRDQFLRLLLPTRGFIVHAGESTYARGYLDSFDYEATNLGNESPLYLWRDQARLNAGYNTEYTAYTSGEGIKSYIQENGLKDKKKLEGTFFQFVPYNEPVRTPEGGAADSFLVTISAGYKSQFNYDAASATYKMSEYDENTGATNPAVDENNGEQLAFENAVVLFTSITPYEGSYVPYVAYDGGEGYLFTNGHYEKITWDKAGDAELLKLYGADGEELLLNPGKTYLSVVGLEWQQAFEESIPGAAPADTSGDGSQASGAVQPG